MPMLTCTKIEAMLVERVKIVMEIKFYNCTSILRYWEKKLMNSEMEIGLKVVRWPFLLYTVYPFFFFR